MGFMVSSKCEEMLERIEAVMGSVKEVAGALGEVYQAILERGEVPVANT